MARQVTCLFANGVCPSEDFAWLVLLLRVPSPRQHSTALWRIMNSCTNLL